MTIQFGNITFGSPVKLGEWSPRSVAGLYCVCVMDEDWRPAPYRPLYFAASDNLAGLGHLKRHDLHGEWVRYARSTARLMVAHADLPEFDEDRRELFARQLAAIYQAPFNRHEPVSSYNGNPTEAAQQQAEPTSTPGDTDFTEKAYA